VESNVGKRPHNDTNAVFDNETPSFNQTFEGGSVLAEIRIE
jgi:hypothetical protein